MTEAFHAIHRAVEDTWKKRLTDGNTDPGIRRFRKKEEKGLSLHRLCHIQKIQHCMGKLFILSNICAIRPCVRLMGIAVSPDLFQNEN